MSPKLPGGGTGDRKTGSATALPPAHLPDRRRRRRHPPSASRPRQTRDRRPQAV